MTRHNLIKQLPPGYFIQEYFTHGMKTRFRAWIGSSDLGTILAKERKSYNSAVADCIRHSNKKG